MELSYEQYSELMDELVAEGYDVLEASEMIFDYLEEQNPRPGQNPTVFRPTPGAGSASGQGGRRGSGSSASQMNQSVRLPGGRTATRVMSDLGTSLSASTKVPTSSGARNVRGGGQIKPPVKPAAPAAPAAAPATRPAGTTPTAPVRPVAAPAARPSAAPIGGSGTKVVPSSTPAAPKPAGTAMQQWAAANPKLAAAAAERARTRGTSATTNPLMQDLKSRLPAPSPSSTTPSTAFAKTTPSLGSSSTAVQAAGTAAAAKPTTTGVTGFKMSADLSNKKNQQKINAGMEIKGNELQEQLRGDNYGGNARPDALLDAYRSIYDQ